MQREDVLRTIEAQLASARAAVAASEQMQREARQFRADAKTRVRAAHAATARAMERRKALQ